MRALDQATRASGGSDEDWVTETYRLLGYAIREANGSRGAQYDAWQNYLDRVTVDDRESREVKQLIVPLRPR